jgi:hypothetical protein
MIRSGPFHPEKYARRFPSGDHAGSVSNPAALVSRCMIPPSRSTRQIAPWSENAIALPSGEIRGMIAPTAVCPSGKRTATPAEGGAGRSRIVPRRRFFMSMEPGEPKRGLTAGRI